IEKGKSLALVGESGSGKSVTAKSIMQLLPYPMASHPNGSIEFKGQELIGAPESILKPIRGDHIGMIFQEPLSALNPLHNIETQIGEVLELHKGLTGSAKRDRIVELMEKVGLNNLTGRLKAYPHELSGGQRQRVMIAMALANDPDLLIADEPTTALDVTIQAQILELLNELRDSMGMALLLISHDLHVVEKMVDDVCVMKHGEIVEHTKTKTLFSKPQHAYTKKLLSAQPSGEAIKKKTKAPVLLETKNLKVYFPLQKNFFGKAISHVKAVDDISFSVKQGQTIGVVGESGSGKSTLGFACLNLVKSTGEVRFDGNLISGLSSKAFRPHRADMQIVFQDPFGSLSPRMSIGQIVGEGLGIHRPNLSHQDQDDLIVEALQNVHLDPATRHRYPHEFSGGQRQRVSIARALILHPKLIVMDEPTSALDMSVQSEVVDLLRELQEEHALTYMFISHDLRVVRALSHEILVMKQGKIVEAGSTKQIFDAPKQDYTKNLMRAALDLKA
ncbi:MAG: ABC transporter ATP-binding protein, partial [Bdellovibrionales bacterium]